MAIRKTGFTYYKDESILVLLHFFQKKTCIQFVNAGYRKHLLTLTIKF